MCEPPRPKPAGVPQERAEHDHHAEPVRGLAEHAVVLQPSHRTQDGLPVMTFHLSAGHTPKQYQLQRARVGNVGGEVQQIFSAPPEGNGRAESVTVTRQRHQADQWDRELGQASAKHCDELAEWLQQYVPGFVEDQVDAMEKRLQRGAEPNGEGLRPDQQAQVQQPPRSPEGGVSSR